MKKGILTLAASVLMGVTFAACSNDDAPSAPEPVVQDQSNGVPGDWADWDTWNNPESPHQRNGQKPPEDWPEIANSPSPIDAYTLDCADTVLTAGAHEFWAEIRLNPLGQIYLKDGYGLLQEDLWLSTSQWMNNGRDEYTYVDKGEDWIRTRLEEKDGKRYVHFRVKPLVSQAKRGIRLGIEGCLDNPEGLWFTGEFKIWQKR